MTFIATARAELANLERELEGDPRWLKLKQLRELVKLYEGTDSKELFVPRPPPKPRAQPPSDRLQILEAAKAFVEAGRGKPMKTAKIYEMLVVAGFHIGGRDPKNNLSAMLSNWGELQSNGRLGWTLKAADGGETNLLAMLPTDSDSEETL